MPPENYSTKVYSPMCADLSRLLCSYRTHPHVRGTLIPFPGEVVPFKQLAFSSRKANLTAGNLKSFHKSHDKFVSTLTGARILHLVNLKAEPLILFLSSKTWWCLVKSVFGVCSPSSLPSLQMVPQPTPLVRTPNDSIPCLLPNLECSTPRSL